MLSLCTTVWVGGWVDVGVDMGVGVRTCAYVFLAIMELELLNKFSTVEWNYLTCLTAAHQL